MKRRMFSFVVILGFLMLSLSSCIPSVELNKRAIVQAIGVDAFGENYRVTLQIFSPEGGDSGVDASEQNAKLITADGNTISDAIQSAALKQGKQIFYGHNRLLVIGAEAAKNGIRDILPFFNSGYQSRPSINVMIAKSKAEDILGANIKQGIVPAESLENMVDNYNNNGSVVKTQLLDVIQAIYDKSQSVALPAIELTGEQGEEKKEEGTEKESIEQTHLVVINGAAILKEEKLVGFLNKEEMRGVLWLTDRVKRTLLVFSFVDAEKNKFPVSIEIYQSKTKNSVQTLGVKPVFTTKIEAKGRINEMDLSYHFSLNQDMNRLEKQAAKLIQAQCENSFIQSKRYQADIFQFANLCMQTEKNEWKRVANNWPQIFGRAELNFDIRVKIERIGVQTNQWEK